MSEENQVIIKALNMYGRVPKQWELLNEIERLNNIIKEVREYIKKNTKGGPIEDKRYFYSPEQANDILKILDKGSDKE